MVRGGSEPQAYTIPAKQRHEVEKKLILDKTERGDCSYSPEYFLYFLNLSQFFLPEHGAH